MIKFNISVKPWQLAILVCLSTSLLGGCSSASLTLNYYLLHATSAERGFSSNPKGTPTLLTVDKLVIPDYLKQRGLVHQLSETNIHISTSHLWAEPVDEGIFKELRSTLSQQDVKLIKYNDYAPGTIPDAHARISILINDFISSHDGEVILSGEYVITAANDVAKHHSFSLAAPIKKDGFEASIKAMRATLDRLSKRIKADI